MKRVFDDINNLTTNKILNFYHLDRRIYNKFYCSSLASYLFIQVDEFSSTFACIFHPCGMFQFLQLKSEIWHQLWGNYWAIMNHKTKQ